MEKGDIDKRIIEYVTYLIDNKEYKSEAEYLRTLDFPLTKLSDAKKGKAGFRSYDIGIILMNDNRLNSHWVMTGEGEMLCTPKDSAGNMNFIAYLKEEKAKVEQQNRDLNIQLREAVEKNAFLEGRISEMKKINVPKESNATCADASGSDLEK